MSIRCTDNAKQYTGATGNSLSKDTLLGGTAPQSHTSHLAGEGAVAAHWRAETLPVMPGPLLQPPDVCVQKHGLRPRPYPTHRK